MEPIVVENPLTDRVLVALASFCTPEELDLMGSALSPSWRFVGSPLVWRARVHAHYDQASPMRMRSELLRERGDGTLVWGGVEDGATHATLRDAMLAALCSANGAERVLCQTEAHARLWERPPRPLAYVHDGHTYDLDTRFSRSWHAAGPAHVVPPAPNAELVRASDTGDIACGRAVRGRYPQGGIALALKDDAGGVVPLTVDVELTREHDPLVCLDTHESADALEWACRLGLCTGTGQTLLTPSGTRLPIVVVSTAWLSALPFDPTLGTR